VQCNIVERGAINHMGGCMVAGGPCIGCTMPGFPDKYSPFYKAPPGSAFSGTMSKAYGGVIRRLRRMSMRGGNREPLWDNLEEVPSPWAREHGKRTAADKTLMFFYKRLQYSGTANHAKRYKHQPIPESLDILRQEGLDFDRPVPVLSERVKSPEEI
jgi:hydrogenase small subunit